MHSSSHSFIHRICQFLIQREPLLFLLATNIFLRIPSLFEPYWYGDEAIYLTIGTALRHGLVLYRDIIDHKTPIIYLLAMVPSQFWFKLLLILWTTISITCVYTLARNITKKTLPAVISTLLFLLCTTLPWFEGHIANGELFVMGFVLVGMVMYSKTKLFQYLLGNTHEYTVEPTLLFFSGVFFSLGALTKVPAIFDAAAIAAALFLAVKLRTIRSYLKIIISGLWFGFGFLAPILVTILFFAANHATQAYLDFGLLYNFRYSAEFSLPFTHPVLRWLFSMPGKLVFVTLFSAIIYIAYLAKKIRPVVAFFSFWLVFALFSTLLSSRPYPHYWLQFFPPAALFLAIIIRKSTLFEKGVFAFLVGCFIAVLLLLQVGLYPVFSYYKNFALFVTHKQTAQQYRDSFNWLMPDTYVAEKYIQNTTMAKDRLFIWGTNPMLYALSQRVPAGRFTVSFHIKDFSAYNETMEALQREKPPIIVVMHDEQGAFDEFYTYLHETYVLVKTYPALSLYRRLDALSSTKDLSQ